MRSRYTYIATGLLLYVLVLLTVRHYFGPAAARRASEVVRELGGGVGFVPIEPSGTAYYFGFHGTQLSRDQLSRLSVIDSMHRRDSAAIYFHDTNLIPEDIHWLHSLIPRCHISLCRQGEVVESIEAER